MIRTGGKILTASFAIMAATQGAWAIDAQDFSGKVSELFQMNGMLVEFDTAQASGNEVILSGLSLSPTGEDVISVPARFTFSGVTEHGDGSYTAEAMNTGAIDIVQAGSSFHVDNIALGELYISADPNAEVLNSLMWYRTFEMGNFAVSLDGVEVVTIEGASAVNLVNDDNSKVDSTYEVRGIHAEPGTMDIGETSGMLALLELQAIDANMQGVAVWEPNSGLMEFTENSITVDNVGKLNVTGALGGYDLDFIAEMLVINRKLAEASDASLEEMEAISTEMMMVFQGNLSLIDAKIRFDDDSATGKVLDLIAALNGAPREIMVAGFAAAVPAMAAEAGLSSEMQEKLGEAATQYLADPQNIEISVKPEQPAPFLAIAAMAEEPGALEGFLGLDVKANQ